MLLAVRRRRDETKRRRNTDRTSKEACLGSAAYRVQTISSTKTRDHLPPALCKPCSVDGLSETVCVPGLSFFFFFASDKQGAKTSRVSDRLATGTDWPNARGGTCQKSCEKRKRQRPGGAGGAVQRKAAVASGARKAGDRRCMPAASPSLYLSAPVSNHMMHAAKATGSSV